MANTYTLIAKVTVGSGGSSTVSFTSIPSTYNNLQVLYMARCDHASTRQNLYINFNSDTTASNYSWNGIYGYYSGGSNQTGGNNGAYKIVGDVSGANSAANAFVNGSVFIGGYTSSYKKNVWGDPALHSTDTDIFRSQYNNTWTGTGSISTIDFTLANGSFVQNTTFYLYGISNT